MPNTDELGIVKRSGLEPGNALAEAEDVLFQFIKVCAWYAIFEQQEAVSVEV